MKKICESCGTTVSSFWSMNPLELCDGKIICHDCAEYIEEDIYKLSRVKLLDKFIEIKNKIIDKCNKRYETRISLLILELIYKILRENKKISVNHQQIEKMYGDDVFKIENYETEKIKKNVEKGIVYSVEGVRGRSLEVYEDKIVINTTATIGSFLTGNVSDGEKTIYFVDCVGVQFKQSGALIGYLQLETAGGQMNNKFSIFFNENSFTYDTTKISNEEMKKIVDYIKNKIKIYKHRNVESINNSSAADEIRNYKKLLDDGIITEEEFKAKKKQLLGL